MSAVIYPDLMAEKRFWTTPASMCFMGNSVDADMVPLLKELNSYHWMVTTSCCTGHGNRGERPYISLAVKSSAMSKFVGYLQRLQAKVEAEGVVLDCQLDFCRDCATSCDFRNFPDWLMFCLEFWGDVDEFVFDLEFWQDVTVKAT